MTGDLDDDVIRYLAAVGAVAVYIATADGMPLRVGFSHDPRKTKLYLMRRWPVVELSWLAWFDDSQDAASSFIEEISNNAGELVVCRGTTIPRLVPDVIAHIVSIAHLEHVTLTPHADAVERAKACSVRLDDAMAVLQLTGELGAFNQAYRIHHEQCRSRRESVLPYWAARDTLRRLIIRHLVTNEIFLVPAVLAEICEHFPWFRVSDKVMLPHHKSPQS